MSFENSIKTLEEDLNTRFHIILGKVFFWPHSNISLEEHTNVGFIDYILKNAW